MYTVSDLNVIFPLSSVLFLCDVIASSTYVTNMIDLTNFVRSRKREKERERERVCSICQKIKTKD